MSNFGTDQDNDQLIYDDSAFRYFFVAGCAAIGILLFWKIVRDIFSLLTKKPKITLGQNQWIYKDKLAANQHHIKNNSKIAKILTNLILLIACITVSYLKLQQNQNSSELSGFDPYQILNIDIGATDAQIKKAYRKLALQLHPDTNQNDPLSKTKFILVSKAYKCLTDLEIKQNCLKYGNPDGEIAHKVGIGLPQFLLDRQNILYVAIVLLSAILFIGPSLFFLFIKKSEQKQINFSDRVLRKLLTPLINQTDFCVLIAVHNKKIVEKVPRITEQQLSQLRERLQRDSNLGSKLIREISSKNLQLINVLLKYLEDNNFQLEFQPQILFKACNFLLEQSLRLASIKHYKNVSDLKLAAKKCKWFGLIPSKRILKFCWMFYNKDTEPKLENIFFLTDFSNETRDIFQKFNSLNPHILISDKKIQNQFISYFQSKNKHQLSQQLECLPEISISSTVTIDGEVVEEICKGNIAKIEVKIKNNNKTFGAIISKNYPYLQNEQFLLIVSHNSVLYSYFFFNFNDGVFEICHSFLFTKVLIKQGILKLDFTIWSLNYPNFIVEHQQKIQLFKKSKVPISSTQKNAVHIHEEDKNIQKVQKNFYQKLIEFKKQSESDAELSDSKESGEQPGKQDNKIKTKLRQKIKQKSRKKIRRKFQKYGILRQEMPDTQLI